MSQNSVWVWTRVTHHGESSADDKRPVCNKIPRQTFSRLRRLHQCTSNCTSGCRCRSPATPLPSQASPAPVTTPVFHLPPPLDYQDGVLIGGRLVNAVRFADDQAMVADTKTRLQRIMDTLTGTAEEFGMKINTKKTKVMSIRSVDSQENN